MSTGLPKSKKLVPISEAAEVLGVSIDTVRRWDKKGVLHSERPDGKNRFFSIDELEKVKFGQPLPISEASNYLKVSTSTLRRLEERGLITPDRNGAGERVYDRQSLEKFLNSDYFLRQKKIEEKILEPLKQQEPATQQEENTFEAPKETPTNKVLTLLQHETSQEVSKLVFFKKAFYGSGLFLTAGFVASVVLVTALFLAFPLQTAKFFGYKTSVQKVAQSNQSKIDETSAVLGVKYIPPEARQGQVLGVFLKPISNLSLQIVKQVSPQTYEKIVPKSIIQDVNDILTIDDQGNITPKFTIKLPDSTYIQVPDKGLVGNLNADYIRGKVIPEGEGQIAVINPDGTINNLKVDETNVAAGSIITVKIADGAVTSPKIADGAVTADKLAAGLSLGGFLTTDSVTSSDIKDGAVTNSKLANSSITFAADSGTSTSSSLGDTRTFSGAGIVTTSISGSTITITGTEADTLASVTARGAITTAALTLSGNVGIGGSLSVSNAVRFNNFDCSTLGNGGKLTTDSSGNLVCSADSGGGGSLTPWTSDINGGGFNLSNVGTINTTGNIGVGGSLTITGLDYASGGFRVNGFSDLTGNVGVGTSLIVKSASVLDSLQVTKSISSAALGVSGVSNLFGNVGIGGSLTVNSAPVFSALGSGVVQSNSLGGLSSGAINLGSGSNYISGVLSITNGGTGASTSQGAINNISQLTTTGDLLYFDGSNSTRFARGNSGQCLTTSGGTLSWGSCGTGGGGGAGGWVDYGTAVGLSTITENVGIGTTPSVANAKLEIQGNGNSTGLAFLTHNNANSTFGLVALDNGNGTVDECN